MQKNLQSKTIEKRSQLKSGQITAVIYSIKIIIKFYLAANTVVTYPERHTVEDDSEKMQSNHNQNKLQIVVEPSLKIVGEDSRFWTGRPGNKNDSYSLAGSVWTGRSGNKNDSYSLISSPWSGRPGRLQIVVEPIYKELLPKVV